MFKKKNFHGGTTGTILYQADLLIFKNLDFVIIYTSTNDLTKYENSLN